MTRGIDDELTNAFATSHPATVPTLKLTFEDFRRDAEVEGDAGMMALADRALPRARLCLSSVGGPTEHCHERYGVFWRSWQ
jgi:hypothetical protein